MASSALAQRTVLLVTAKGTTVEIRKSIESDKTEIAKIHRAAFGEEKGSVIADLAIGLLADKTAMPLLSLVAVDQNRLIGHVIYTKVSIAEAEESVSAQILAPLAVLPDAQRTGVGTRLIKEGLEQLRALGVELVFVLGHPDYYPRCGFTPAGELGFEAPYPIPEEHAAAWMVQDLTGETIGRIKGRVQCSEVLSQPEHWRE